MKFDSRCLLASTPPTQSTCRSRFHKDVEGVGQTLRGILASMIDRAGFIHVLLALTNPWNGANEGHQFTRKAWRDRGDESAQLDTMAASCSMCVKKAAFGSHTACSSDSLLVYTEFAGDNTGSVRSKVLSSFGPFPDVGTITIKETQLQNYTVISMNNPHHTTYFSGESCF